MLTNNHVQAFAKYADANTIADVLIGESLIGTEAGDAVLAHVGNDPAKFAEVRQILTAKNVWEAAA